MEKKYDTGLSEDYSNIKCQKCDLSLEIAKVKLEYLGNGFPVDLAVCPKCKMVYIPEDLAIGKMLHVEQSLEDK